MKTLQQVYYDSVYKSLQAYFNVLKDDGVILDKDFSDEDCALLSKKILDDMYEAEILEFEKQHEADLETYDGAD